MVVGASSCYASPLCTWFVAACMSVSHDGGGGDSRQAAVALQSGGRSRRRRQLTKCSSASSPPRSPSPPTIQALVSSCLDFGPCTHYSNTNNNALSSLFGSNTLSVNRNQRRLNRATPSSGGAMAVMEMEKEAMVNKKPPTEQRRVVVTGMGVETPLGHDPHTFYENLLQGNSGISQIENFDCSEFPTRIAGEIKSFSTEGWVAPKLSKRMDKFMLYLLTAGKKALADGGVTEEVMAEFDKTKCGVLIGSAMGGMKVFYDAIEALRISYKKMNPFCVPFATTNMGSAMLAMDLGWMGPNYSISTACATSNFCILNSANHIIKGEADVMLCGGSDAVIIPIGLGGFVACRALSQRNNDPTKASRPWDSNRDGFVMGEGAGVLLLEELEHAKKRGATIYAEFLGGSFTCDAYHMTEPHPDGAGVILCIERALASAGVSREQINYINAHATSTHAGDLREYQALVNCFGQNPELKVNSTKSMIGHLLGAAGAVEAVATIQAIRTGWVHPNINLENPDSGVDTKLMVGPKKERLNIKAALSNSFGFGGHNSSIIFAPYK
ncbi:PREDICTED: 3-oxoacyl-[acyl-carrier-protein] synthase II, chloroplastic-like [Camelina sativa]|uniref:beta-ketoacyl-[acyl-carrier-protein] synthase I n=1 Tax=Camelina sativa TaxID=90675 RepID=K4HZC9_CAMSA|nr:3-oxoacyl-[acyl-carrier-protein] synthase II, chloroplastic-like [Camelina sativa]XP_010471596.1 PREDICTED: 3-oxoacyl-[acyl-carrier-protein] synthase II, chloroplastic-like [Camelina sativa]AFU61918.1 beta-ketoacyl-ACP synthase II [Camelina sativa]